MVAPELPLNSLDAPLSGCQKTLTQESIRVQTAKPNPPSILVVDDNHDNVEIVRQYLEYQGYSVLVAHNGDEALAQFETRHPAVVLLDVMMPGRDGWEVCRLMKQHPTFGKTVRVIMVTALGAWDDKREALQLGA